MRSVAVLGAGTMGAQIAAHFANAGVPTLLLDLTEAVAREGLERARKLKPDPFFVPEAAALITTGGFDTHLERLSDCNWILEAIVERLDVKQSLFERVERHRAPGTIVSTNTSGIPIGALAEGRTDDFRRHFLGTHFFNPPRYLSLLELIPTPDTDPAVLDRVRVFGDRRLGKGVVLAKDTPNFIANHIGTYGVLRLMDALTTGDYSIEEIDAITGPATGRPKSATFRTMDIAGIDVLGHVIRNFQSRVTDPVQRAAFAVPPLIEELERRKWVGEKSGAGFYKRVKSASGSDILVLDPKTMEYRPRQRVAHASLEAAKGIEDPAERIKKLFLGRDKVGHLLRESLGAVLVYTARVTPAIAHSIDDVDRAMRWGFAWELGPFETWDAIGIRDVLEACHVTDVPPLVADVLAAGRNRFRESTVPAAAPDLQILRTAHAAGRILKKNAGASLVDLGDGVLCVEFHSKMNALGPDAGRMLLSGVQEAERNFQAIVVGNDAPNFSVGANLMLVLLEAQDGNWDELDALVRQFQHANMTLRYASVPVVVAPAGLTLGGGCEVALHADRIQAAAETYMGLVEVGVGLIPAGGGTKEMVARSCEHLPNPLQHDLFPFVRKAFEVLGFGKVATSAADARKLGFLRATDHITMNRERLLHDAKQLALVRVGADYQPPLRRDSIPVGGEAVAAGLKLGVHLAWRGGYISDHDKVIATRLAHIMAGGNLPRPALVSEQYLLDLEREAFLSLLGERKTLERMQHMLKTGKPLRN
ncbi:MAG: 3-hydroxyacyl-CoA dehydrogenase/enoyl-CoA hydratase family protein [Vicinamibacterales bacterium]